MTIRFASAARRGNPCVSRWLRANVPLRSANDNGVGPASDRVLKAALRHFADHGLGAAERARENAENAFFAGEREAYRWWMGICRMLDSRMADAIAAHTGAANDALGPQNRRKPGNSA